MSDTDWWKARIKGKEGQVKKSFKKKSLAEIVGAIAFAILI